jgi:hypothetical protein
MALLGILRAQYSKPAPLSIIFRSAALCVSPQLAASFKFHRAGLPSLVSLLALGLLILLHLPHDPRSFTLVLQPEILIIGEPPRLGGIGAIHMLAVRGDDPDPRPRLLGISRHGHNNRSRNQSGFKQQGGLLTKSREGNGPSTGGAGAAERVQVEGDRARF